MNNEWAELNKTMQTQIKKKDTYKMGIDTLLCLRSQLMQTLVSFKEELCREDFNAMPFINADGYHSKTVAYSVWHIFRIEDIVVNSLIREEKEILFEKNFDKKIGADIITTGNELKKQEIAEFSKKLNIDSLYEYAFAVKANTDEWLKNLQYEDIKKKFGDNDKKRISELGVVSNDDEAIWLIDYWCNKDISGLIKMPLSRHWIMHIEACLRIKNKIHS